MFSSPLAFHLTVSSLFGYMVFMILAKWCTDWSVSPHAPPSLIGELINMALHGGSTTDTLYPGQGRIEAALLAVAALSAPWMLFAKPALILWRQRRQAAADADRKKSLLLAASGLPDRGALGGGGGVGDPHALRLNALQPRRGGGVGGGKPLDRSMSLTSLNESVHHARFVHSLALFSHLLSNTCINYQVFH